MIFLQPKDNDLHQGSEGFCPQERDLSYPIRLHLSIEYLLFSPQCRKCCESRHDLFSDKKLRLMIGILDILKTKLNEMVIQVPVCHLE
jgi:hypothetical protein